MRVRCVRVFPTHPTRLPVSVYTRLAHANENGIKLGNLNGQKTLRASRLPATLSLSLYLARALPVSLLYPERARERGSGEMGDKSKNARMQIEPDL